MKKRWLIAGAVFLILTGLFLPQLASDIHYFLLQDYDALTIDPIEGWRTVLQGGNPLWFFLILAAAVLLILFWVLFTSTYLNYRSNMWEVTPDIYTPCADGQGQFGTARWLKQGQIGKYFGVWKISKRSPELKTLLAAGKKDQEEIKKAHVQLD